MKKVSPKVYTKKYYLSNCGGYEEYLSSEGDILNPKLIEITKYLGSFGGKCILDIGCGRGELTVWLAKNGAKYVVGIDYSKNAIDLSNKKKRKQSEDIGDKIHFYTLNAKNLNRLKMKFDIIIMTEVFEHLYMEEIDIVFDQVKKILTKDGFFLIHTSPNKWFYDYFYRYWSYPVSNILISVSNFFTRNKYPRLVKYEKLRDEYHKKMHVNEPTYFSLRKIIKKSGFSGTICTSNITVIKPIIGIKDTIFNCLVYLYPVSKWFPFNILMGGDFHAILKSNEY